MDLIYQENSYLNHYYSQCSYLIRLLIYGGSHNDYFEIERLCNLIHYPLEYPILAIVIRSLEHTRVDLLEPIAKVVKLILQEHVLFNSADIIGIIDDQICILKYEGDIHIDINKIKYALKNLGFPFIIASGLDADYNEVLACSYRQASWLASMGSFNQTYEMDETRNKVAYIVDGGDKFSSDIIVARWYNQLVDYPFDLEKVSTLIAYAVSGCLTLTEMAEKLGIHKNTITHQLKKIYTILGIDNESHFDKQLILKKILLYHRKRKILYKEGFNEINKLIEDMSFIKDKDD